MAVGDNRQMVVSTAQFTTNSSSYVNVVTFQTGVIPLASYMFGMSCDWQTEIDPGVADIQMRLVVSGFTLFDSVNRNADPVGDALQELDQGVGADDSRQSFCDERESGLSAGDHTVTMDIRRLGGAAGEEVSVRNIRIWVYEGPGAADIYQIFSTSLASRNQTSYATYLTLDMGVPTAGTYHIMYKVAYRTDSPTNHNRQRLILDQTVSGITILYGTTAGGADEPRHPGMFGLSTSFPWQNNAGWFVECVELEAEATLIRIQYSASGGTSEMIWGRILAVRLC